MSLVRERPVSFDFSFFYRKKKINSVSDGETKLARVLNLVDLTALGVSCTLGSGVYVLVGDVVVNYAGPSIVLSFLIAGIASFLAGLCYAELGARVPTSGSAYVYIYVTIGEFIAFLIGWQVILEYVIGTSSTSSALTQYIDSLFDNKIQKTLKHYFPMNIEGLAEYPDFFSFGITLLITVILIVGVKESSALNKVFTLLNLAVVSFIFVSGIVKSDLKYWNLSPNTTESATWIDSKNISHACNVEKCGTGGFFPFGFNGIIKGFDCIATTGEEVQNPKRAIPLSIIITLIIVAVSYCGVSAVITLMMPYYMLDANTPFPTAYDYVGLEWAKYIVVVGAIASLATCLYASMFPMPRVVYSMASDGLIFRIFSYVSPTLRTPINSCIFTGVLAATMSLVFNLNQLIEMMSIGTLMAYTLVAASTLVLRYRPSPMIMKINEDNHDVLIESKNSNQNFFNRLLFPTCKQPTEYTAMIVNIVSFLCVVVIIIVCGLLTQIEDLNQAYAIALIVFFSIILLILSFAIWQQPQDDTIQTFKVPCVPFYPLVCIFFNVYLMFMLTPSTWIRFAVWFVLGIVVYFLYAIRFSLERDYKEGQLKYLPCIVVKSEKIGTIEEEKPCNSGKKEIRI